GSEFGYSLLFIIFLSNIMAMLLQALSIKLGVVSGLAEVIGSAIAMNLLFNLPLPAGVAITACDILLILLIYRDNDIKAAH
ncbi:3689_t:CDS:2, partial [Racocetra persica]